MKLLIAFLIVLGAALSFALGWYSSGYQIYSGMYSKQEQMVGSLK